MALPKKPLTNRERYYSVIAGQNTADILPEKPLTTEEEYLNYIAKHGGGGTGAVDSVNGKTGNVILDASDVGALPDSTSIPAKTSDLTNDSNFVSDENYTHTDNNYTTAEKTKLAGTEPLIFFGTLAEWNALTDAEKAKYRTLKIPDTRVSDIEAVIPSTASSSNKLATAADVADKVDKIAGKGLSTEDYTTAEKTAVATIANKQDKITQSSLLTLTVAGWDSTTLQQTVTVYNAHNPLSYRNRNVIDITLGEEGLWDEYGVYPISKTSTTTSEGTWLNTIVFECDEIPSQALTFKITSMKVS